VITELVINHTSDQHAWFQRARLAPKDSPERAFYVWSDDPTRYADARIFFSHQPDLNFDNPAVVEAVKDVMRFWFRMGVDGMRLDAIPYLVVRDGTNCENLADTHKILKELRRTLDDEFDGRVFLAEANQWPS